MAPLVQDCRSDSQAQDNKEWNPSLPKGEGEALSDVQRWDFVEEVFPQSGSRWPSPLPINNQALINHLFGIVFVYLLLLK